jgi:hypothetical protein
MFLKARSKSQFRKIAERNASGTANGMMAAADEERLSSLLA